MKIRILPGLTALLALTTTLAAQTTSTEFAPANFSDFVLTSMPSNATGNSGVSTVYSTSGQQLTLGTGGSLVNSAQFNYKVTGPNTATISLPASGSSAATTTNLVFTGRDSGTYTTVQGNNTTTGRFSLAEIPFAAPLSNVSVRTNLTQNNSTIIGFVIAGTQPRRVLIRGVGPGLASLGVSNPLPNPTITLYRGSQALTSNDDWGMLSGGTTAGTGSTSGTGTSTGTSSTGSTSGTGTTTGSTSTTSTGSTSTFTGTLANGETFTTELATSQDFTNVGAFPLAVGSHDAAIVATLPPGPYTILVSGVAATTTSGSTSGGTTIGTSSGSTSSTGTTSGGTSSGTGSTTGGASAGSTSGGSTSGTGSTGGTGSTSITGSTTGMTSLSGTGSTTSTAGGDVLVEVYFLQ